MDDQIRDRADASTGQLVTQMSQQVTQLVRDELRLAQLEVTSKGKKAGLGIGLLGGSGLIAVFGLAVFVAAAILGLAVVLDAWLAAVIVGVALVVLAGITALVGKRETAQALPPAPTQTVHEVQADVAAVKEGIRR